MNVVCSLSVQHNGMFFLQVLRLQATFHIEGWLRLLVQVK